MTITAQTAKSGPYAGNGSTTSFAYTFYIRAETDLVVTRLSTLGVETVLTLNVDYTVSGVGAANGGAVALTVAPTVGQQLVITRLVSITQSLDLENLGGVRPVELEIAYDKLTQIAQDQQEQISRSVKVDLFGETIGLTGTKAQFNVAVTDGNIQYVGDAPTAHTHLLTELVGVTMGAVDLNELDDGVSTTLHFHNSDRARANHTGTQNLATISDVTVTAANLNILDDGLTTALHFHDADRARGVHTGTQLASTVSDFTEAAQDAVGAMVATSIIYNDAGATMQRAALTGHVTAAQDSNALILGSFTKTQLDTAVSDGNIQYVGDAPTAHTHLLAAGATDVTVTAANLNILDDGLTTALHFHDADRARGVHTGTQLAATISDFSTAVAATASVTANTAKFTNATHTGDVTGATALTIAPTAISGKTLATAAGADHVLIFDATDSLLKKALVSDFNSGVSDGDKGDITVSAAGTTWTIDASTVTLAKQADMATGSLVYRKTAGAGAPEVQTLATLKTDLGLTGTNSGDQTITLTGAVTGSGVGSFTTSLGSFTTAQLNSAVSDADLPTLAANNTFTGSQVINGTGTGFTINNTNSTTAFQWQVAGSLTFDTASLYATAINTTLTGGASTTIMRGQLLNTTYNPTLASPLIQNVTNQYTLNSNTSPSAVYGDASSFNLGASALGGTVAIHYGKSVSTSINAAATTNITSWFSYHASNIANGALQTITNAYSFVGLMSSGSGRRNLSMTGTADNVLSGNLFVGSNTSPTAKVHIAAGSATANTAPLKLTSGALNTTPEAGAVEFLTGDFFGTNSSGTRKTFAFLESPALVTPALGTPASGVMTNVTGLTTAGLVDGSITTAKLAAAAVDTSALAALAVTSLKISSKAVSTGKIDDGAVTPAQIKIKAVVALADAAAVLSATQMVDSGIFTITPTAGRNLTTGTATNIVAQLPDYQVGTWFDFTIVNLAAFAVVLVAGAGVTIVGSATANNVAATWRCLVTSSTTVTIYRT